MLRLSKEHPDVKIGSGVVAAVDSRVGELVLKQGDQFDSLVDNATCGDSAILITEGNCRVMIFSSLLTRLVKLRILLADRLGSRVVDNELRSIADVIASIDRGFTTNWPTCKIGLGLFNELLAPLDECASEALLCYSVDNCRWYVAFSAKHAQLLDLLTTGKESKHLPHLVMYAELHEIVVPSEVAYGDKAGKTLAELFNERVALGATEAGLLLWLRKMHEN